MYNKSIKIAQKATISVHMCSYDNGHVDENGRTEVSNVQKKKTKNIESKYKLHKEKYKYLRSKRWTGSTSSRDTKIDIDDTKVKNRVFEKKSNYTTTNEDKLTYLENMVDTKVDDAESTSND